MADNIRFVVTFKNKAGMRTLAQPAQGRHTHATHDEATAAMEAMILNSAESTLEQVFGSDPRFAVRSVECWPGHNDPIGVWFD